MLFSQGNPLGRLLLSTLDLKMRSMNSTLQRQKSIAVLGGGQAASSRAFPNNMRYPLVTPGNIARCLLIPTAADGARSASK